MKRAIVLLSGGLDSATCLALAKHDGFECYAMSFDYGQRHRCELAASENVAKQLGAVECRCFKLDLNQWGGSALTDASIDVPEHSDGGIPVTYVPARNLVFLSLAAAWGEVLGAHDLYIGVNSVDYSGYPDCRPAFIKSFELTATLGTKAVDENWTFDVRAPLQFLTKAEIIKKGLELGVDYSLTHSCYNPAPDGSPCLKCDSCALRQRAFAELGMKDPAVK